MDTQRFSQQLAFIIEADKIKHIVRKSKLFDGSKYENDAEHSWTICLMACLLREYANFDVNIEKVLLMLLIHDIVEIDAGDTFLYSQERATALNNEDIAAQRIFGILPADQFQYIYAIWQEFEAKQTNEAKFATVFDRFQPVLQNYKTQGSTWKQFGITTSIILEKNKHIEDGSREIWAFFKQLIEECVEKGYLVDDRRLEVTPPGCGPS